jgi:SAM-dependent methyltransferase
MNILQKIFRHGLYGSYQIAIKILKRKTNYDLWRVRNAPIYSNPTPTELKIIEAELSVLGISLLDYTPNPAQYKDFGNEHWFSADYHGGRDSGVWDEKLLEHWIAADLLGLMEKNSGQTYVDVAAANSPWSQMLRERKDVKAYAIDLCKIGLSFQHLSYYLRQDATSTEFLDSSINGASLQCAFEMFQGDDDTKLIYEMARVLKPGGKLVILPLYMHTHYCSYSSADYFGKGYSPTTAKEYVRLDIFGIQSSRKYDPVSLKKRILDPILELGMKYSIRALRNKSEFGNNIYCHFILEVEK